MPLIDTFRHLHKSVAPRILTLAAATAMLLAANGAHAAVVVVHPLPRPPVAHVGGWIGGPVWIAPPPRVVVAPTLRPGWVWSAGYWNWTGSAYVWIDGVWLADRPGLAFVPAHWEHFYGGWRFVDGCWIQRPF